MSGYFEEVERELRAAVRARSHVRWYQRRQRGLRPPPGTLAVTVSVVLVLVIAGGAVTLLGHSAPQAGSSSAPPGARALIEKLAVLRRPQTAADRDLPAGAQHGLARRAVPSLTRLVAAYPNGFKLFIIVAPLAPPASGYGLALIHDGGGGGGETAQQLEQQLFPGFFGGPDVPSGELNDAIVPDGVVKVKWRFSGLELPHKHFPPVTIYPRVRNNVALAPVLKNQGLIESVTDYSDTGKVIAYETPAIQQRQICAQHPSQCPLRTKMPRLIGLSTGEAQTEIDDVLGFPVSIVRTASSAPPGTVVAQNPNPRTPIKGRIRVSLTISTG